MGIIAKSNGGDFELTPNGSFIGRCYRMIDIGTQPGFTDQDKPQRKVYIYWELLEDEDGEPVTMKDNRPFSVNKKYTLSINPKANLRKDLDAWRGIAFKDDEAEAFDITKLLGTYCRIQVVHEDSNGKTYANVSSIGYTKKKPEGVNDTSWWSVEEPDMEVFEKMPDYFKEKIEQSPEFRAQQMAIKGVSSVEGFDKDEPINLDDLPA
jgi:hypothetical protein